MDSQSVVRDTLLDVLCIVQMVDVAAAALAPGQLQQGEDLLVEGDVASPAPVVGDGDGGHLTSGHL